MMKKILPAFVLMMIPYMLWSQPCNPLSQLPFTETFDTWGTGTSVRPNCWTMGSYSYYPYIASNGNGGELNLYVYNNSSSENVVYACLPEMGNSVQINHTQLILKLKGSHTNVYSSDLIIGVCDTAGVISSFTPVDTLLNLPSDYRLYDITLESYTGSGKWITLLSKQLTHGHTYYTNQVFLDELTLEVVPNCRRPRNLQAYNATTTSVVLNWDETGQATSWEITYGPTGYTTGTTTVVNYKPYTLTGLTAATQYEFNVRSICNTQDTGAVAISRHAFSTTQQPATLPYNYGFEESSEWANWQHNCDNTTIGWVRGNATRYAGGQGAYISADSGSSVGNNNYLYRVNACLYRDIDLGSVDSSYTLNFMARAGGTYDFVYDGLMVLVEDPAHGVVTPTMDTTSPWGSINRLHPIALLRCDTTWRTYSTSIDNISGVQRLVFYWFNMSTSYYYSSINYPAAIDNIELDYSPCPRPTALRAEPLSYNKVRIAWDGPVSGSHTLLYKRHSDTAYLSKYVSTNPTLLTGLEGGVTYDCKIRKICGLENSVYSDELTFSTPCPDTVRRMPYVENFEGGLCCWEQQYVEGTVDWTLHNGDAGTAHPLPAYEGAANILLYNRNTTDQSTLLISPVLDFTHYEHVRLNFAHLHRVRSQRVDSVVVMYRTSAEADWEVLASYSDALTAWRRDSIELPRVSSTTQVAFEGHTLFGFGVAIDNIRITADTLIIPLVCETPTDLHTVTYTGGDSVVINWNCADSQRLWEVIRHTTIGDSIEEVSYVTANHPVTLAGLMLGEHTYSFRVRALCDTNFYSDWSDSVEVTTGNAPEGIDGISSKMFSIYPNPSTGKVFLQMEDDAEAYHLLVTDMTGRIVKEKHVAAGSNTLQLELPRGCYLVKVWNKNHTRTERVAVIQD